MEDILINTEIENETESEKIEKFRARNFNLILYQEDETHRKAIDYIQKNYDYAMISHDKDIDEKTGKIKKQHYHIVVRFKNAKWNTSFAEDLKIPVNYIEESRSLKRSLQYLIHYNDENKYQYDITEVQGTLTTLLKETIQNGNKTESEKILEIFQWIDEQEQVIDTACLIRWSAEIGYWDVLRRGFNPISKYLDKHNINYS